MVEISYVINVNFSLNCFKLFLGVFLTEIIKKNSLTFE